MERTPELKARVSDSSKKRMPKVVAPALDRAEVGITGALAALIALACAKFRCACNSHFAALHYAIKRGL